MTKHCMLCAYATISKKMNKEQQILLVKRTTENDFHQTENLQENHLGTIEFEKQFPYKEKLLTDTQLKH